MSDEGQAVKDYFKKVTEDDLLYFYECLRILEFGTKRLIPFRLNVVQRILHDLAEDQFKEEGHVR